MVGFTYLTYLSLIYQRVSRQAGFGIQTSGYRDYMIYVFKSSRDRVCGATKIGGIGINLGM
jgi:hypothetical protein